MHAQAARTISSGQTVVLHLVGSRHMAVPMGVRYTAMGPADLATNRPCWYDKGSSNAELEASPVQHSNDLHTQRSDCCGVGLNPLLVG